MQIGRLQGLISLVKQVLEPGVFEVTDIEVQGNSARITFEDTEASTVKFGGKRHG